MQNTGVQTLSIPSLGSPAGRLTQAGSTPMRLLVRNTGGNSLAIATDVSQLTDLNNLGGCYLLPAGQSDVFVLAPMQSLFACSLAGGGQASIAWSEAVPLKNWMES